MSHNTFSIAIPQPGRQGTWEFLDRVEGFDTENQFLPGGSLPPGTMTRNSREAAAEGPCCTRIKIRSLDQTSCTQAGQQENRVRETHLQKKDYQKVK